MARDGDRRMWIALALVYLLWGSTYLGIRVMVETLPPLLGSAVRFLVAGALLAAWTALRRGSPVGPGRREAGGTLLLGLLLVAGGPGLTAVAERDVPSGLAALVVATVPLWVVLLRRLGGERPAPAALLGVVLGFAGVALVVLPGGTGAAGALGLVLLVVVALSFATGSVLAPRVPGPRDALARTGGQLLAGGVVCAAAGLALGEHEGLALARVSTDSWLGLAYLVGPGTVVAYSAYVWLLDLAPVSLVATYAYVNPVVALVLGWAVLGEGLGPRVLLGAAVVLASVALVVTRGGERPGGSPTRAGSPGRATARSTRAASGGG